MNVDLLTRIEGTAGLEYIMQKNEISAVNFKVEAARGFESILEDKEYLDVHRIASRICGMCHASQAIASCKAVERILDVEPPAAAVATRSVVLFGELVKSHAMHFFFQGYPDLEYTFHGRPLPLEALLQKDPVITTNMFELIKAGKDITDLAGGREIHAITLMPGGVTAVPIAKETVQVRKTLARVAAIVRPVIDTVLDEFEASPLPDEFTFPSVAHLALAADEGTQPAIDSRQAGNLAVRFPNGSIKTVSEPEAYTTFLSTEAGIDRYDTCLDNGMAFLTGPPARRIHGTAPAVEDAGLADRIDTLASNWEGNALFTSFLQLVEILAGAERCAAMLADGDAFSGECKTALPRKPVRNSGVGIVEAPRGILIHDYEAGTDGRTGRVKILIATKVNIPLIEAMLTARCRYLHDHGHAMDEIKRQASSIVRTFDPCVSCTTHVIRQDDEVH
jgi:coenzyme F420-reducing hydrogenase alpha subunit